MSPHTPRASRDGRFTPDDVRLGHVNGVFGLRGDVRLYLYNPGSELIGERIDAQLVAPDGSRRTGPRRPRVVFGPTCDSLDRLPDGLPLPDDCATGDYVLFPGLGAYSSAMSTQFNGYGLWDVATVIELTGQPPA